MVSAFLGAAFPWIVLGIIAAVCCSFMGKEDK